LRLSLAKIDQPAALYIIEDMLAKTVEINGACIGFHPRDEGSKVAEATKTIVIEMAEPRPALITRFDSARFSVIAFSLNFACGVLN
jgi:hypothetical protein